MTGSIVRCRAIGPGKTENKHYESLALFYNTVPTRECLQCPVERDCPVEDGQVDRHLVDPLRPLEGVLFEDGRIAEHPWLEVPFRSSVPSAHAPPRVLAATASATERRWLSLVALTV